MKRIDPKKRYFAQYHGLLDLISAQKAVENLSDLLAKPKLPTNKVMAEEDGRPISKQTILSILEEIRARTKDEVRSIIIYHRYNRRLLTKEPTEYAKITKQMHQ